MATDSRPTTSGGVDNIGAGEKFTSSSSATGEQDSAPAPAERMASIADDAVDAVLCVGAFEHMPDPHAVLVEVVRVLRPGGAFETTMVAEAPSESSITSEIAARVQPAPPVAKKVPYTVKGPVDRIDGTAEGRETPIGIVPKRRTAITFDPSPIPAEADLPHWPMVCDVDERTPLWVATSQ